MWLIADAALGRDDVRVRLGPLVGTLLQLVDGVGQGRRSAVHQFGVLMRALVNSVKMSTLGVGLGTPARIVQAMGNTPSEPRLSVEPSIVWPEVGRVVKGLANRLQVSYGPLLGELPSDDVRFLALDAMSPWSLLIVQFVDDSFLVQSTIFGLQCANRGLAAFCRDWRHQVKGGSKRPVVLSIGAGHVYPEQIGRIGDIDVAVVQQVAIGGIVVDDEMTMRPQLEIACARVMGQSESLASALCDVGFGLPFMELEFWLRVVPSALYGW